MTILPKLSLQPSQQAMHDESSALADFLRSCWLVPVTAIVLWLISASLHWVGSGSPGHPALSALGPVVSILYLAGTPFAVMLIHFRVHKPREQRVVLAFVTGIASLGLGFVLTVAWYMSVGPL